MKRYLLLAPAIFALAHADTIRLRDGSSLEGMIISETADAYVAMIQVTPTIRDQRTIAKKDVLEIVTEKKDEKEFAALAKLVPAPDLLSADDYQARIKQLEEFVKRNPATERKKDVDAIIQELETEAAVVREGGVKWKGKMISADEKKASAFTLDSAIAAARFSDHAAAGRSIPALRAWDELSLGFPTSRAYLDAVPAALRLMERFKVELAGQIASFDERTEKRQSDLAALDDADVTRTKAVIEDEAAEYLARVAKEKEDRVRWLSISPWHKEPMTEVVSKLDQEIRKLQSLKTETLPDGDAAWTEAWKTLNSNASLEDKRAAVSKARTARLPKSYLDQLTALLPDGR
ncbi:MAG: hypothetical protein MUF31_01890 [Akkermansiaceae bacterium]|jgi:hypothetical protein|nr:hypothetical protein [Akkermansiaceae bacterium]